MRESILKIGLNATRKDSQDRYELGRTFAIPGPSLSREKLFMNASKNDYSASAITYLLECSATRSTATTTDLGNTKTDDDDGHHNNKSPSQCSQFFVDSVSGDVLVNMSQPGAFDANLIAKDADGQRANVKHWSFKTLPLATDDDRNGPNGYGCGLGVKVGGVDKFISKFTCTVLVLERRWCCSRHAVGSHICMA